MRRSQVAKMDIEAIVREAVSKALASKKTTSKKTSKKVVCEKVSDANKKAEKAGFPTLLTTSKAVAKRENFKTTKDGKHFECRDCGVLCRTYGVVMNHYRNQTGNTKVKAKKL